MKKKNIQVKSALKIVIWTYASVLIFNKTLGKGRFMGKAVSLEEFMDSYKDSEFEIITEGYFGNTTTYSGWLWEEGKNPVSAIMYIWKQRGYGV